MKPWPIRPFAHLAGIVFLLASAIPLNSAEKEKPGITVDWGKMRDTPMPDDRYSAPALKEAFGALCKKLEYQIVRVEVDQSAIPFVLYGVLDGRCDYHEIHEALNSMAGYVYGSSVTLVQPTRTLFALNMTPFDQYPHDRDAAGRLRERMRKLALGQR